MADQVEKVKRRRTDKDAGSQDGGGQQDESVIVTEGVHDATGAGGDVQVAGGHVEEVFYFSSFIN